MRWIVLVCTVTASVAVPMQAPAQDMLPAAALGDIAPRIVNGSLTSLYPTVGALLTGGGANDARLACTGTLIGCETFLTAGHCVESDANPSHYTVFLQHAGFFGVASIALHPDYDFPVADVAVLKLASPVTGIAPSRINVSAAPTFASDGRIVGFGRAGGSLFDYGLKRSGSVVTASCPRGVSNTTSLCWAFSAPIGAPGDDSNTCNGDSGGPLFIDFGCGDLVAGVTSGGTARNCRAADRSFDANVFSYRAYIEAHGGADLDNASCGGMPQAGEPGAPILAATGTLSPLNPDDLHSFSVASGSTLLRVAMNASEGSASDFDLYVKQGSPPSTSDFDCKTDGSNQYGFCEFINPAAGTWYALVHAFFGSAVYQVTATVYDGGGPGTGTDGQPCDDGNDCTASDACLSAVCTGASVSEGTLCDDGSACTRGDSCAGGSCAGTDALIADCKTRMVPGRGLLMIRDRSSIEGDRLTWRWLRGASTTLDDLGTPTATTEYELCLFDETGTVPVRILDVKLPPGGLWSATPKGYHYRDRTHAFGGISRIVLRSGADGDAAIRVRGRGVNLATPDLPLSQDSVVRAQLTNGIACWEAEYRTNAENYSDLFKAHPD